MQEYDFSLTLSSTYTSLVKGFHCQVSSEGGDGVHLSYENLDLKSMVRSLKAVDPALVHCTKLKTVPEFPLVAGVLSSS